MQWRSSTSNSSLRLFKAKWGRTWLAVALVVIALMLAHNAFWRHMNYTPRPVENMGHWSNQMKRATAAGPETVVLIGSSRTMNAIKNPILSEELGGKEVIPLYLLGSSSLPVLKHLAEETNFTGMVLVGFTPIFIFDPARFGENTPKQYLAYHKNHSLADEVETWLSSNVENRFFFRPPVPVLAPLLRGQLPKKKIKKTSSNKDVKESIPPERGVKEARRWARKINQLRAIEPGEVEALASEIETAARKIESRGGKVILIRYPSSGIVRKAEEKKMPKAIYWDVLAANLSFQVYHFEDREELAGFSCWDGSHLDKIAGTSFTRELGKILAHDFPEKN